MQQSNRDKYIKHGSILAITSFFVRIVGMLYRIPMTSVIGDRGNGLYSGAFEIYNIILLVSTYTLPMAISKIVSPMFADKNYKGAYRFLKLSFAFALVVGGSFAALTFFGADILAGSFLKSPMSALALRFLAPTILVVSLMGVVRGIFQSTGSTVQTSISQIIEQLANAVISIMAAYMMFGYGKQLSEIKGIADLEYSYGAAGGTVGTLAGAVVGLFYLMIVIAVFINALSRLSKRQYSGQQDSYLSMLRVLLMTIFPIILSTAIYNLNTILNQAVFYNTLADKGVTAGEYESLWGIFSGKYRLLCNVPIAMASSMAASVIPTLSVSMANSDSGKIINFKLNNTVKMVMIFTIPCVIGLSVLSYPIIDMLFNGSKLSQKMAGDMLRYASIVVLFTALSTLSTGFLQGLGFMRLPIFNTLTALIIQLVLFKLMLDKTDLGIYAMLIANILFMLIISILNSIALRKKVGYRQKLLRSFVLPTIASVIMGLFTFLSYRLVMMISGNRNGIATIISIFVSMLVYFVLIIKLRVIGKRELAQLPKGTRLVALANKLRLW